jgi:hypothetical protein
VGLAFENAALSEALTERTAEVATSQRQTDALRGLVGGAVHDAHLLLDALLELQRPPSRQGTGDSIAAIERELRSQLEHLASLPGGEYTRRGHAEVDLNALVVDAAPILRSILGPEIRMLVRPDRNPARVRANRRGLDRMLRSLVTVVGRAGDGQDLVLRVVQKRGRVRVELAGPAVGIDDRVIGVAAGATSSVDEVGFDLWQVRCEALLNNLHLGVRKRTDGDVVYFELARSG